MYQFEITPFDRQGGPDDRQPEDKHYGDRMYAADDLEGHRWYFATHVRDVPPEEMSA